MALVRITQERSKIRCIEKHKRTIEALGLRRINHSVVHEDTPQIRGMVHLVRYLVRVEPVGADARPEGTPADGASRRQEEDGGPRKRQEAGRCGQDRRFPRQERHGQKEKEEGGQVMKIGQLKPARGATHPKKRRGLGPASGLGGTAGKGHKGQKARAGKGSKVPGWFEGGQMPIQRRIPKRGFHNPGRVEYQPVNVGALGGFAAGAKVDRMALHEKRLIGHGDRPVKLLGEGEITLALQIAVDAASASARAKIEAAGGTITLPAPKTRRARGEKKAKHEHVEGAAVRGRKPKHTERH